MHAFLKDLSTLHLEWDIKMQPEIMFQMLGSKY